MASHSSSHEILSGAAKLCQDIAALINNRQDSDVHFKVGGISTQENGETIYDESATVTLYAHSLILRCRSPYFVTLLDNDKDWKEKSQCIIYKPNISPNTFEKVLCYIYTGDFCAINLDNIVELITVANEMGLEELSTECQSEFIRTVKYIFSDEDESTKEHIPVSVVIHTHIIPALNLASNHSLSSLSRELLTIMSPHMSVITKSPDAYTKFISEVSSEALVKIISSDDLAMTERSIWDLAVDWACCQTKLSKTAIETRLSNFDDDDDDDEPSSDGTTISRAQLKQFKKILIPLLPSIRFNLLDFNEYRPIVNTLTYVLPRRQYVKINEYFLHSDGTALLNVSRKNSVFQKPHSMIVEPKIDIESKITVKPKIVVEPEITIEPEFVVEPEPKIDVEPKIAFEPKISAEPKIDVEPKIAVKSEGVVDSKVLIENTAWELLRESIFETGGILGCHSSNDLKFELLFRASQQDFRASAFHYHCDNNGPTLTIIKSIDGHLFGGVNFNHWKSDYTYSASYLNFLFALPDGFHRKDLAIFRIKETHAQYSSNNFSGYGPVFGKGLSDLLINDSANYNLSNSKLPSCYDGDGASDTALAGSSNFVVSDYEVFAILNNV